MSFMLRALLACSIAACATTSTGAPGRSAAAQCDEEAPGTLRISNSSGRMLDVYVARGEAQPQLITQLAPGASSTTVPGPADLGVRYDIVDPNARQRLATVTWLRPFAREISRGVVVELICASNTPPPGLLLR